MMPVSFGDGVREVLFLGAHCDDIEIGCGGALATLARTFRDARLHIVVFSGNEVRAAETRAAVASLLGAGATYQLEIADFRDGYFPTEWARIKDRFEELKRRCNPDVIFTHYEHDRHQDHRTVCELTWNTFRNHTVFEYEVPKFDGDLGRPSFYLPLSADIAQCKVESLLKSFPSQAGKRWFTADLFSGLMRLRGMECNAESGFAEAFYVRKLVGRW